MTYRGLKSCGLGRSCLHAACFVLLLPAASRAADQITALPDHEKYGHSTALGVNFPGVNVRMFFSDSIAAEIRGQYLNKIFTAGPRLYYYPSILGFNNAPLRPFIGVEGDFISFKGEYTKGNGAAFGGVIGVEYFLSRSVSVQTDAGPYYIMLDDNDSAISQTGLEFVLNFGVNFYF